MVKPGEALFELLGGLNITDRVGPSGVTVLQELVAAIKDAVLLLAGRGLHSSTSQLILSRFRHTSPCPPV